MLKKLEYSKQISTQENGNVTTCDLLIVILRLYFSSLNLKNGQKKHVRNIAELKDGFVKWIFLLFTRYDYVIPSMNILGVGNVYDTENSNLIKQNLRMNISINIQDS